MTFYETENQMANFLDDLLVIDGKEQKREEIRRVKLTTTGKEIIMSKAPARAKVKIASKKYDSNNLFISVIYQNETCNFDMITLQPTHECVETGIPHSIKEILPYIRATLKEYKAELASIAFEANRIPLISKRFRAEKNKIKY